MCSAHGSKNKSNFGHFTHEEVKVQYLYSLGTNRATFSKTFKIKIKNFYKYKKILEEKKNGSSFLS